MKKSLNIQGRLLDLSKPVVMGILNVTPDSFFPASRAGGDVEALVRKAGTMVDDGAAILDIGGYSTRPGAKEVSVREEVARVVPAVRILKKQFPSLVLSVDTFRSEVAEAALGEGAAIINDVSGGDLDPLMFDLIVAAKVPYIIMHMRGTPSTMQRYTSYNSLVKEVTGELGAKVKRLTEAGVCDLIIDPGFGFSKTMDQNYSLLKALKEFRIFNIPLLAGVSRKSMIYKFFDTGPEGALNGTTALNMYSLLNGAGILRVHDVKEARETIDLFDKITNSEIY